MEFEHKNKQYRLERGVGTGRWLLLVHHDDGHRGWRLTGDFPAYIDEVDVVDHAKNSLNRVSE